MPRRIALLLALPAVLLVSVESPGLAGRPSRAAERRSVRRVSEIRAAVADALAARPKDAARLPAQLRMLQELAVRGGNDTASRFAGRLGVQLSGDRVRVAIRFAPDREAAIARRLGELGAQAVPSSGGSRIEAFVPLSELDRLVSTDGVLRVEASRVLVPTALSEGVATTGADAWMGFEPPAGLPLDRPARVAIVDVGFEGYAALLGTELPAEVDIQAFCSFPPQSVEHCDSFGVPQPFEHGTAVAEIVHDMAPEAELMLLAIDPDIANIQAALTYARTNGADIVSASIGTQFDNRDGTSELCATATTLRRSGVVWSVSAGNAGDPCEHESYTWRPSGVNVGAPYGQFQSFPQKTVPILNEFVLPAGFVHLLQLTWNAWDAPPTDDLDLFYFCDFGAGYEFVAESIDEQCGVPGTVPFEGLVLLNDGTTDLPCAYAIAEYLPGTCRRPADRRFDVGSLVFDEGSGAFACPQLEDRTSAYSISHPADCADAFAVGAVCATSGEFETYSGQGPTFDGRAKPEICAPDAVSTETYGTALDCPTGDLYPGFNGTSASAPHVAGALALLFQRVGGSFTPEQCRQILERRAGNLEGSAAPDDRCGRGVLCLRDDGCP